MGLTDNIPSFKTIDGLRYKYQSWHHTKEGAEEVGERLQRAVGGSGGYKKLSVRVIPHGKGKSREWRVYTRMVVSGQRTSPIYRGTPSGRLVKKSEVVQVHKKGGIRGGRR